MSVYDFKKKFKSLSGELDQYVNLDSPYSQQSIINKNRVNNIVSNMEVITFEILEPANSWATLLQKALDCVELNDLVNCHTNLSEVQSGVINSMQSLNLQLSVIEDTLEEVENSSDIISQGFQSEPNSIDTASYNGLRSTIEIIFDEMSSYKDFCQTVINDMHEILGILALGTNPYDYEMYNSITVLKMQIFTSRAGIQTLRTDYFG